MSEKKFIVKIIHEFEIVAENEQEAEKLAIASSYGEARDCYLDVEEAD